MARTPLFLQGVLAEPLGSVPHVNVLHFHQSQYWNLRFNHTAFRLLNPFPSKVKKLANTELSKIQYHGRSTQSKIRRSNSKNKLAAVPDCQEWKPNRLRRVWTDSLGAFILFLYEYVYIFTSERSLHVSLPCSRRSIFIQRFAW